MGATFSRIKTWGNEVLYPADLNAEFDNILNNFTPSGMDDYSTNTAQMQSTADPYPGAVESLATTGAGELERLRYVIKQITGEAQWYIDPDTDLATTKLHIDSLNAHYAYAAKTTTYTLTATDHIIAADGTSAAFTVTLPTAVGITGKEYIITKIDASANAITIDGNGSETIDGQTTYSLITQWDSIIIRSNGANWISPARYSQTPTIVDYANATHTHDNAANGGVLTGHVVQFVEATPITAFSTGTTVIPVDNSIPQNTEGDEKITATITPKATTNKLEIKVAGYMSASTDVRMVYALFQDSTANALKSGFIGGTANGTPNNAMPFSMTHIMTAGTVSATTFKLRVGPGTAATVTFNGQAGADLFGGVMISTMTITEIAAS